MTAADGMLVWFVSMETVYSLIALDQEMKRTSSTLTRHYVDKKGIKRFTGVAKKLKASQLGPYVISVRCSKSMLYSSASDGLVLLWDHCCAVLVARCYTMGFGYRIGELLPDLPQHITGLRSPQDHII